MQQQANIDEMTLEELALESELLLDKLMLKLMRRCYKLLDYKDLDSLYKLMKVIEIEKRFIKNKPRDYQQLVTEIYKEYGIDRNAEEKRTKTHQSTT